MRNNNMPKKDEYIYPHSPVEVIRQFNTQLLGVDATKLSIGLFDGKIGLCVYLMKQFQYTHEVCYEKKAEQLLEDVYAAISDCSGFAVENGLIGLGLGFVELMESGAYEGNPNHILKDVDDRIYRHLSTLCSPSPASTAEQIKELLWGSIYLCKRCVHAGLPKGEKVLFRRMIIRSINRLETSLRDMLIADPLVFAPLDYPMLVFLHLLRMVQEQGLYDYKIERLCRDWIDYLAVLMPMSIGHRFLLGGVLGCLGERLSNTHVSTMLAKHSALLRTNSDMDVFLNQELGSLCLPISVGVAGLWFVMRQSSWEIPPDLREKMIMRIESSEAFKACAKPKDSLQGIGLITGQAGVVLAYQQLKQAI